MPSISVGGAIAASSVIGAGASLIGSSQSAGAAKDAANLQAQQYQQTRADLLPYNQTGQGVLPALSALATSGPNGGGPNYLSMASGNLPGQMTEAQLEQTPGYQFNLAQGLKSTQNAAAARGLGVSGAALKGAATYATGLADSTYQNQFNNAQTKFSDIFNLNSGQQTNVQNQYSRLAGTAGIGANAAATTAQAGTQLAATGGNALIAGGNASAAGTVGVGTAAAGGVNSYLGYNALQGYLNPGGTGGYVDNTSGF